MVYRDAKYQPHSPKDLLDHSFWSHFRPFIQRNGRVTAYKVSKKRNDVDVDDAGGRSNESDEESAEEEEVMKAKLITILCCILCVYVLVLSWLPSATAQAAT